MQSNCGIRGGCSQKPRLCLIIVLVMLFAWQPTYAKRFQFSCKRFLSALVIGTVLTFKSGVLDQSYSPTHISALVDNYHQNRDTQILNKENSQEILEGLSYELIWNRPLVAYAIIKSYSDQPGYSAIQQQIPQKDVNDYYQYLRFYRSSTLEEPTPLTPIPNPYQVPSHFEKNHLRVQTLLVRIFQRELESHNEPLTVRKLETRLMQRLGFSGASYLTEDEMLRLNIRL